MEGVRAPYIGRQAGHSVKMLLEFYARWIPGGNGGSERARLVAAMGASAPDALQNSSPGSSPGNRTTTLSR